MNPDQPLLNIDQLSVRFKTYDGLVQAVDRVSFEVAPGETMGLVGESGCGKSVTAMSILRLLKSPPAQISGRIEFQGQDLLTLSPDKMRAVRGADVSMIFQEPMTSLNPVLTIGRQISESVMLHRRASEKEAWARAVEMLRLVQIPAPEARAKEYPHKLSGGMRQRAMIAMALSCDPKLVLADEPTTALDVTIQAQIMHLLRQLKDETGASVILITHDLGVIAEMASRVVVMYAGRVAEEAPVRDLFHDPKHPYTRGLLESIPKLGQKFKTGRIELSEIKGVVPSLLNLPTGCRFSPRCDRVMDVCKNEAPPMVQLNDNRRVRCWLYK